MKFLSDCSGDCYDCYISYVGMCLAGHGDDDFIPVTVEKLERLCCFLKEKNDEESIKRLKKAEKKIKELTEKEIYKDIT